MSADAIARVAMKLQVGLLVVFETIG